MALRIDLSSPVRFLLPSPDTPNHPSPHLLTESPDGFVQRYSQRYFHEPSLLPYHLHGGWAFSIPRRCRLFPSADCNTFTYLTKNAIDLRYSSFVLDEEHGTTLPKPFSPTAPTSHVRASSAINKTLAQQPAQAAEGTSPALPSPFPTILDSNRKQFNKSKHTFELPAIGTPSHQWDTNPRQHLLLLRVAPVSSPPAAHPFPRRPSHQHRSNRSHTSRDSHDYGQQKLSTALGG